MFFIQNPDFMNIALLRRDKDGLMFRFTVKTLNVSLNSDLWFRFGGSSLCPAGKWSSSGESWIQDDHFVRRNLKE